MKKLRIAGLALALVAFAFVCTFLLGGCGSSSGGDSGGDTDSNNWDQLIWNQGIWQ